MVVRKTTVIEKARKAAGVSQQLLARWAGTTQSSISEYESRRKSPTLAVVERLLDELEVELTVRPVVTFDVVHDPVIGQYLVPERLWSVPLPDCFSRVVVLGQLFGRTRPRVWDLSVEDQRIDFFEWAVVHGSAELLMDSVDGVLLMQVWAHMNIPEVVRAAWQPVLDATTASQDAAPRDPGGVSAWFANELGVDWRPPRRRKHQRESEG